MDLTMDLARDLTMDLARDLTMDLARDLTMDLARDLTRLQDSTVPLSEGVGHLSRLTRRSMPLDR